MFAIRCGCKIKLLEAEKCRLSGLKNTMIAFLLGPEKPCATLNNHKKAIYCAFFLNVPNSIRPKGYIPIVNSLAKNVKCLLVKDVLGPKVHHVAQMSRFSRSVWTLCELGLKT